MPRSKTASKQAEILDAAARVFSARPYHLVLIDDVAQAAHVGKGTIYRYFETKEDLHFAAILYGFDALAEALSEASLRGSDPAVRLERIAHEVIAFFRKRGNLSKLLMENERRFEARTEELDKRREVLQRLVEECLADGAASGVFRVPDVTAAATLFRGMIRAAVESRNPSDTPEGLAAVILEIFVQGIGRKPAEPARQSSAPRAGSEARRLGGSED